MICEENKTLMQLLLSFREIRSTLLSIGTDCKFYVSLRFQTILLACEAA